VSWLTSLIYSDDRLFQLGAAFAPVFLFIGLAAQPRALLRRNLAFAPLAVTEVMAMFLGGLGGIVAAWNGAGVWALVVQSLLQEFIGMVLVFRKSNWRLRFQFNWMESKGLVTFGGYLTAFELIGYLNFNLDKLAIAWVWGSALLGFYDKAFQLLLFPLNHLTLPLGKVIYSTLSRLQHQPEGYRRYFYWYTSSFAAIGMPLVALIYGTADLIIPFLLGPNWMPSVDLFKALAPAAFCMTISPSVSWIYISLGRAKRQLFWQSGLTIIWLLVMVIALQFSVWTVAAAYSVTRVLTLVPTLVYVTYGTPVSWSDILKSVRLPALATLASLGVLLLGRAWLLNIDDRFWQIIASMMLFLSAYLLIWFVIPSGRRWIFDSFRHVRSALNQGAE
jgi:O-antigen/teichoic acid export membrane protein